MLIKVVNQMSNSETCFVSKLIIKVNFNCMWLHQQITNVNWTALLHKYNHIIRVYYFTCICEIYECNKISEMLLKRNLKKNYFPCEQRKSYIFLLLFSILDVMSFRIIFILTTKNN